MKKTNETVEITITSPLLRPGLTLSTKVSKKYAADATADMLDIVREINRKSAKPSE